MGENVNRGPTVYTLQQVTGYSVTKKGCVCVCVCVYTHTHTHTQGAYKLSEDFAKPYFHKYSTEIHDVTNI